MTIYKFFLSVDVKITVFGGTTLLVLKMKLRNRHSKKPKSFIAIAHETYKDFAENTSIHGLKYTVKSDIGTGEKIFWAVILFLGLTCAIYMTFLFWNRYVSNPTRTTIKTYYAPTTIIPFPAVTICNVNVILESKLKVFMDKLNVDKFEKPMVTRALSQLLSFTDPNAVVTNETEINFLHGILFKFNYTISFVMKQLAQNCSEMLKYCAWNGITMNCSQIFDEHLTANGYCCSFNYGNFKTPELYTAYNGIDSGLLVILDPMPQTVQYSSFHFSGFKTIIHDPTEFPGAQSLTKMMSSGNVVYLQIYGSKMTCSKDVAMLPSSHRHCVYPDEIQLKKLPVYSDSNCFTECEAYYYYEECKCVPYYYDFIGQPQCNVTQIPCLTKINRADLDLKTICDCPSQCEDDFYNVYSGQTPFDYNKSYSMIS